MGLGKWETHSSKKPNTHLKAEGTLHRLESPPPSRTTNPPSKIALPEPKFAEGPNLWTALNTRRPRRTYDVQQPIGL